MMTIEIRVGRLGEVRFRSPMTPHEVQTFLASVRATIGASRGPLVFVSDMRGAHVFPPEHADSLTAMLRSDNPRIERHGVLMGDVATFTLQMERMLREAGNPSRRTFRDANELLAWVDPLLDVDERARARAFFAEGEAVAKSVR